MSKDPKPPKGTSLTNPLLLLFLSALLIRGVVLFASLDSFNADPDSYLKLAQNWYSYGVFGERYTPTAFRPPLYPAILKELIPTWIKAERPEIVERDKTSKKASSVSRSQGGGLYGDYFDEYVALSKNASIALLHWILGVASILLVWRYARLVGVPPALALIAGFLVAIDPILLCQSRLVMTETLASFFAILLILTTAKIVKKRESRLSFLLYLLLGGLYGLSALCRPAFYAFAFLTFVNLLVIETSYLVVKRQDPQTSNGSKKNILANLVRSLSRVGCFLAGCACAAAPWIIRNDSEFGIPIAATTHGGYTLCLANNPELYAHYKTEPLFSLWNPESFHERSRSDYAAALKKNKIVEGTKDEELFQDRWYREQAIQTIQSDPSEFFKSCLIRIGELWRVQPNKIDRHEGNFKSRDNVNRPEKISGSFISTSKLLDYARFATAAFYSLEFLLAIFGILALVVAKMHSQTVAPAKNASIFESPLTWGFLLVLSVQIPHLFYWTNMRMRAPIEVFIPILAVISIKLFQKRKRATIFQSDQNENVA